MSEDRELLELAAKAAGIVGNWELRKDFIQERWYFNVPYDAHGMLTGFEWNPLTDDGDAFRLAVKLRINIYNPPGKGASASFWIEVIDRVVYMNEKESDEAAARRAIVRAAAEIGKATS